MHINVLFTPLDCTATAVNEYLQASNLLLGFLGRLSFLGRFDVCCLLVCALLVGCLGFGLATTGLAAGALSVMLAYACTTTLFANIASSVVLAYA